MSEIDVLMSFCIFPMRKWKFRAVTCPGSQSWEITNQDLNQGFWSPVPSPFCAYGRQDQLWVQRWSKSRSPSVPSDSQLISETQCHHSVTHPCSTCHDSYSPSIFFGSFILLSSSKTWRQGRLFTGLLGCANLFQSTYLHFSRTLSHRSLKPRSLWSPWERCGSFRAVVRGPGCLGCPLSKSTRKAPPTARRGLDCSSDSWRLWSQMNKCWNSAWPFAECVTCYRVTKAL